MSKRLHVKFPLFLSYFNETCNFLDRVSKKAQLSSLIKICLVEAEFFHADRRTDGHEENNIRSSRFCKRVLKGSCADSLVNTYKFQIHQFSHTATLDFLCIPNLQHII